MKTDLLEKLDTNERAFQDQDTVEAHQIWESMGRSTLDFGRVLKRVQARLAPLREFDAWLKKEFRLSRASGYSYIKHYSDVSNTVSEPLLDFALKAGYTVINDVAKMRENPAPKTKDPVKMKEYLEKVTAMPSRKPATETLTQDAFIRMSYFYTTNLWHKLPDKKQRINAMHQLLGMLLNTMGVASEQTISPVAIPASYARRKAA